MPDSFSEDADLTTVFQEILPKKELQTRKTPQKKTRTEDKGIHGILFLKGGGGPWFRHSGFCKARGVNQERKCLKGVTGR